MLMNALLPLAAATIASAHKVVVAPRQAQSTPGVNPEDRLPSTIGSSFEFYGCVSSKDGFPGFQPAAASNEMDLDFCAASCETKYFGAAGNTCYCSDEIEGSTTIERSDKCDTDCPGNPVQACGGLEGDKTKRDVAAGILLTIYERVGGGNNDGGVTATATVTATVTETGTITSCPNDHHCTTGPYTSTRTITSYPEETCGAGVPGNVICYGNYCIFDSNCESCQNQRVVCHGDHCTIQECGPNDDPHRLVICVDDECHYNECHGDDCHRKIVCVGDHCAPVECYGEECKKNLVCYGDECNYQQCYDENCYGHLECHDEHCQPIPEPEHPLIPSKPEIPAPICHDCEIVPTPPTKTPNMGGNHNGEVPPPFSGAGAIVPAMLGVVAGFVALL